ncbi:MAG: hypothetical protein HY402_06815 [Elusimicrobia bacterium]|nr:hypothetical protein [Elusimicrobiota bacterium]
MKLGYVGSVAAVAVLLVGGVSFAQREPVQVVSPQLLETATEGAREKLSEDVRFGWVTVVPYTLQVQEPFYRVAVMFYSPVRDKRIEVSFDVNTYGERPDILPEFLIEPDRVNSALLVAPEQVRDRIGGSFSTAQLFEEAQRSASENTSEPVVEVLGVEARLVYSKTHQGLRWVVSVRQRFSDNFVDVYVYERSAESGERGPTAVDPGGDQGVRQVIGEAQSQLPQGVGQTVAALTGEQKEEKKRDYVNLGFLVGRTRSRNGTSTGLNVFSEWNLARAFLETSDDTRVPISVLSIRPNLVLASQESVNPNWTGIRSGFGLGYQSARQAPDQVLSKSPIFSVHEKWIIRPPVKIGYAEQVLQQQTQSLYYPIADIIWSIPSDFFGLGFGLGPAYVSQRGLARVVENIFLEGNPVPAATRVLSESEFNKSGVALSGTFLFRISILEVQFQKPIIGGLDRFRNFSVGLKIPVPF